MTLTSLMGMFSSAKAIMDWLTACARVIAAEDKPVQWVTPLGLPIVQPYRCEQCSSPHANVNDRESCRFFNSFASCAIHPALWFANLTLQVSRTAATWYSTNCSGDHAQVHSSHSCTSQLMPIRICPCCRNMRKQAVKTVLQSVLLNKYTDGLPVMKSRQRSAFPPNYIHSIDSSHMMMTALACAQEGALLRLSSRLAPTLRLCSDA